MRIRIATAILAVFAFMSPVHADEADDFDSSSLEPEMTSDLNSSDENDEFEQVGWNRWQCWAKQSGAWWGQTFYGTSHYFKEGSGEGQYGRSIAELIAKRNCEFNLARRFYYDPICEVSNCQVQRY